MSTGARLREERERLKLSQTQLADKIGISRVTLGRYESGKREVGAEVFDKLGQLGMRVEYILTGTKVEGAKKAVRALWKVLNSLTKQLQLEPILVRLAVDMAGSEVEAEAKFQPTHDQIDKVVADILQDSPVLALDPDLFMATLDAVERTLEKKPNGVMPSWKKAQLVVLVYRASKKSGKVDTRVLDDALLLTDPSSLPPHLRNTIKTEEEFEQVYNRLSNLGRFPEPDESANGDS